MSPLRTLVLAVAVYSACLARAEPVHVGIWKPMSSRAERAIKLVVSRFRAHHKDIELALLQNQAIDALGLIRRWCGEHRSWRPAAVVANDLWLPEMFDNLQPLPDDLAAAVKRTAPPPLVRRLSHAGKLYGVPIWIEPRVLFYWPKYIGGRDWRPGSWYDVVAAAKRTVEKRRIWGLGIPGGGLPLARLFLEVLWGLGGDLRSDAGLDFMTTAAEQALELLVDADRKGLTQPQSLTWTQAEIERAFIRRKVACIVAGASLEEELSERARYAVAPLPARRPFVSVSTDCLVVFAGGRHTSQALELVRFLASPEAQACLAEAGSLTIYPEMSRKMASTPALKAAVAGLGDLRGLPQRQTPVVVQAIERAFYLAVSGRRPVARALEEAQAIYDRASLAAVQ